MDKSEALKSITIRADSPEVAERMRGEGADEYYEAYSRCVNAMVATGSGVERVISPSAICARDMVEEKMLLERYGVPASGRDLVPLLIWKGKSGMLPPLSVSNTLEDAQEVLATLTQRDNPSRVEGVNLFLLPDVSVDRSEGFGNEVLSESTDTWMLYTLRPSVEEKL